MQVSASGYYIWTPEGWLYLAVVLDLFSRQVVGWAMSNRINKKLVIDSLRALHNSGKRNNHTKKFKQKTDKKKQAKF